MPEPSILTITMQFRLWRLIDGAMDNRSQQAMEDYWEGGGEIGDVANPDVGPVSRLATGIREAGWRQFPGEGPAPDEQVDVALTREQWDFVAADARASLPIYDELARREDPSQGTWRSTVEMARHIITIVEQALTADRQ